MISLLRTLRSTACAYPMLLCLYAWELSVCSICLLSLNSNNDVNFCLVMVSFSEGWTVLECPEQTAAARCYVSGHILQNILHLSLSLVMTERLLLLLLLFSILFSRTLCRFASHSFINLISWYYSWPPQAAFFISKTRDWLLSDFPSSSECSVKIIDFLCLSSI